MKRDKEGAYIMIKGLFQQEYIIVSIYVTNIGASKYIKQISTDIKGEIDSNTIIVGDFNIPLTSMERPSSQKINKETLALNNTLDQMNLVDMQNILSNNSRIHIHLKYIQNILQDRSYIRS